MIPLVRFDAVSKRYELGAKQGSLRDAFAQVLGRGRAPERDYLWALKDVSFEANRGDVVGIIGHNGAGKTTVLKVLSSVTQPTSGRVDVSGRVSALIELGAGFHPDLTGRENIYLNGVILGLTRKEIDQRFRSIVEFAELERFIDTPVKRYSSGMYARLGFSVAAHTDPDLLVVDEVLGVGDAQFQRKCHDFIHAFVSGRDKTALFVSHNLYVVEQLCRRLIWLDSGEVRMVGTPSEVLPKYFDYMDQRAMRAGAAGEALGTGLNLSTLTLTDERGCQQDTFRTGDDIVVGVGYRADQPIERPHFCLGVAPAGSSQPLFMASMLVDGQAPRWIQGEGAMRCRLSAVPLLPRVYDVWGEVWSGDRERTLVQWQPLGSFRIAADQADSANGIRHVRADAPVRVAYAWEA